MKTPTFEMDSENSNLTLEYWVYFVKQLPDKNVTLRVGVTSCKGLWKEELMVSALSLKTLVAIKGIERTFYFWKFEV